MVQGPTSGHSKSQGERTTSVARARDPSYHACFICVVWHDHRLCARRARRANRRLDGLTDILHLRGQGQVVRFTFLRVGECLVRLRHLTAALLSVHDARRLGRDLFEGFCAFGNLAFVWVDALGNLRRTRRNSGTEKIHTDNQYHATWW